MATNGAFIADERKWGEKKGEREETLVPRRDAACWRKIQFQIRIQMLLTFLSVSMKHENESF